MHGLAGHDFHGLDHGTAHDFHGLAGHDFHGLDHGITHGVHGIGHEIEHESPHHGFDLGIHEIHDDHSFGHVDADHHGADHEHHDDHPLKNRHHSFLHL